jgi:hypothetical protein
VQQSEGIKVVVGEQEIALASVRPTIKEIIEAAGLDPDTDMLIEVRVDERIEHKVFDLKIDIIEGVRFEHKPRTFLIYVNGRERHVDKRVLTFSDLVALDPNPPPPGPDVEYTITFFDAVQPMKGNLGPKDEVVIKDGTRFNVRGTNRS